MTLVAAHELVSASEIAKALRLSHPDRVHQLARRDVRFPRPVRTLRIGRIWRWQDVERWARDSGRLPAK
jgi:hypothetical protein